MACGLTGKEVAALRALLPAKPKKQQRRYVTGRNVQINIKAKQETVDRLVEVADRCGWSWVRPSSTHWRH